MNLRFPIALLGVSIFGVIGAARAGEDILDRVDQVLTVSGWGDQVRARVSGTLDFEGYRFDQPAPALIDSEGNGLFTPRLSVFLDTQVGAKVYLFAQARLDRGFDPATADVAPRLDEYAVRFTPWENARLNVQVGKFATFVGNWTARHGSWNNPFISAPLPYENLTGLWDAAAARSSATLLEWAHLRPGPLGPVEDKYLRIPIIWGPSYTTGAAVFGKIGKARYAVEVKQASLSSRPDEWHDNQKDRWSYPTVSTRVGWQPNVMWDFGVSASAGTYLRPSARPSMAPRHGFGSYRQLVLAQDASFAWRHLQIWGEVYASRFEIPLVGHADTIAYYAEAKYKFTPQIAGALRWNHQMFGDINHRGARTSWGDDTWRIDIGPSYRFTAHTQFKLQYSLQHGGLSQGDFSQLVAGQFTLRF